MGGDNNGVSVFLVLYSSSEEGKVAEAVSDVGANHGSSEAGKVAEAVSDVGAPHSSSSLSDHSHARTLVHVYLMLLPA